MREILMIGAQVLFIAVFGIVLAFYSFVFWHWWNAASPHDWPRDDWRRFVAHSKPQKHAG